MDDIQINNTEAELESNKEPEVESDKKKEPNKLFFKIATACIIVGILLWVPNIVFQYSFTGWLFTFPLGIIALVCSFLSHKHKILLITLSILVTISFFLVMSIGYALAAYFDSGVPQEDIVDVTAPIYTEAIYIKGQIYDLTSTKNKEITYIYFGQPTSTDCKKFEEILSPMLSKKSINVFYYDAENMPSEEVEATLATLNIDHFPYLAKIQNGVVIDKVTVADKDEIENFFEEDKEKKK